MHGVRLSPTLRLAGAIFAAWLSAAAAHAEQAPLVARGKTIVLENCARCHAVGPSGPSPRQAAPPFRRLHERYDVEALSESLAEGLTVGHGPMPEWRFAPEDIEAIVAYLKSLQPADAKSCAECGQSPRP